MPERLLTDHIATCAVFGLSDNEEQFKKCVLSYERYRLAYADERPLDKILIAVHLFRQRLRLGARASDQTVLNELREMQRTAIPRLADIQSQLALIIAMRNRELAKSR